MATGFESFDRDLALVMAEAAPDVIRRELAAFAKKSVAELISSGQAPALFDRYVNGRPGLPEEAVELPGPITYEFVNWRAVIGAVIAELQRRSPRKSGRFAASFIVIVNQRVVNDFSAIPAAAEVIITNSAPYVRKAEAGRLGTKRFYIFDGTKRVMNSRFKGAFDFETRWLNVASGVHAEMPYILRGSRGGRRDRQAGQPITYPAVVINAS